MAGFLFADPLNNADRSTMLDDDRLLACVVAFKGETIDHSNSGLHKPEPTDETFAAHRQYVAVVVSPAQGAAAATAFNAESVIAATPARPVRAAFGR